jgi:hypothetical protein
MEAVAFSEMWGLWVAKREKGNIKTQLTTQNETKKCEGAFVSNVSPTSERRYIKLIYLKT